MKKPYSKTLLQGQNGVHRKTKKPLIAKLSTPEQVHKKTPSLGWGFILFLSVDPERFELSSK